MTPLSATPARPGRRRALALALVSALLAGCAITPKKPEDAVRERAQARWDALLKGDFETAYTFISPGGRAAVPYRLYRGRIGGAATWQSAQVDSVTCETLEKCTVLVKVHIHAPMRRARLGTIEAGVRETWLLEDGQWWFLYKL